ncbi:Amylo-alpha-1,6-glucosidase [Pseudonocardia thermophila]|uniref:Amylo-alpha-1,6-glucosidase n=1 Tax=Pseudonocardia thermophila TaxID=1848 RepID=A0A1M6TNY9_PSETH|nr:glycogen debranching N-terminal domain-containing protein [Pseudonocardia thermophila]SHK58636.1 Amylo-alpha-1,6-glucosidase [Pseudonocardia thermophila]
MATPHLQDLAVAVAAPTVCLTGPDGQLRGTGAQGVICGDVRVLTRAVVTLDGAEPVPAGPEAGFVRGARRDPDVLVHRSRDVRPDGLAETLTVHNASAAEVAVVVGLAVGSDLAPVADVRAGRERDLVVPAVDDGALVWRAGAVEARLAAPGAQITVARDGAELAWPVTVAAGQRAAVRWTLAVTDPDAVVVGAPTRVRRGGRPRDRAVAALLDRSYADLDGLIATEPRSADLFATAGAPWYLTLFGRDALWAATMLLPVDPRIASGTLRVLARLQGTRHDPGSGEQPGKILHERRRGTAEHGSGLVLPPVYYGTIDATPLWITLLRDAWRHGMPDADVAALRPNLDAALGWLRDHADRDGDGFAEYLDESGHGLVNQGWKDSAASVQFPDGRIAEGPVALCEVQGYAHEAALAGAELLDALGGDGTAWREWAAALARRFREAFWVTDERGRFPALALDGAKRPVDTATSNIGHLLGTGLLDDAETAAVADRLVQPDLASGYGLRTMSAAARGYAPLSYHCGSVWPHDTAIAIRGLLRTGHRDHAALLAGQLLDAAAALGWRLPELFGGFGSDEVTAPVPYPTSCRPQAWSAAAAVVVAEALAG